jgi:acetylornithine deacetylase/succinyl-diaminopimelate desuccinylase-like protein
VVFYMRVTVPGKATHVLCRAEMIRAGGKGDEIGVNSIEKSLIVLEAVKKLEEEWGQTKRHPLFKPGHFTLHPGTITGGPAGAFVVSEKSTIDYAIWHHPAETANQVKREIEEQINRFAQTDRWLRKNPPSIEWLIHIEPFDTSQDAPVCKAIEGAYAEALQSSANVHAFPATCDGGLFHRAGMDIVVFGPGDLLKAHAANESIMIREMMDAAKVYTLTILQWCGVQ